MNVLKKLTLSRETLLSLDERAAQQVDGGGFTTNPDNPCDPSGPTFRVRSCRTCYRTCTC
jgi:hypothetical protein